MMLMEAGPALGFPYSSGFPGSKFNHIRELRIQHEGRPYCTLYAFNPARSAYLILGGDKTGGDRWYEKTVQKADGIDEEYLKALKSNAGLPGPDSI